MRLSISEGFFYWNNSRCRNLDGTIHPLESFDLGSNAPPMPPRCRSTISAVIEGGTRTAKVKGRNIRVPAEMNYGEFKAVYVDKAKDLQSQRDGAKIKITNAPENPNKHKDEKILAALQEAMVETQTKGEIIYPPSLVIPKSIDEYVFDAAHTQGDKHPHDVTESDARRFIAEAYFAIALTKKGYLNFFGKEGAAYLIPSKKKIRTAFKAEEYHNPAFRRLIEVYENAVKNFTE